ncbi:MAG: hypothetical protein SGPRY_009799 [Prymnesium sp.]
MGILAVNADNKKRIANEGAIAPLVALVKSGTDGQKERAAWALSNLGVSADHQISSAKRKLSEMVASQNTGSAAADSQALNPPGKWRFFISYTQRSESAKVVALEVFDGFEKRGETCWLDVRMNQCDTAAMEEGVKCSDCFIAIITGGDVRDHRYFERDACVSELSWAIEHGKVVVPLVDAEDKKLVGEFITEGKAKGFNLAGCNFLEMIRSNPRFLQTSLDWWVNDQCTIVVH